LIEVTEWSSDKYALMHSLWDALPHDGWDRHSPKFEWFVRKVRGSDLPVLVDDAHKLSHPALSLLSTFQDKTKIPVVMVGTADLVKKMEADPQRFSRAGLKWLITDTGKTDKTLLLHMVRSIAKDVNGEMDDLLGLCQEVAAHHGHFRAVEKQLKLAGEVRRGSKSGMDWCKAFRAAHGHLHRLYELSKEG
jgi:DNA transposition AAA+ family ATPase